MNKMQIDITHEDLNNCTVLEVGSGCGDTTQILANLLSRCENTRLIITDLSDRHFEMIRQNIQQHNVELVFYQTDACDLHQVPSGSVDYLVCNYTLCAINAHPGQLLFALERFYQVLKPGGKIYIEDEYPISTASTPAQVIWAEKWRILKSASLMIGESPFQEIAPEVLQKICDHLGFTGCQWESGSAVFLDKDGLAFFQLRLSRLLADFPHQQLVDGFRAWERKLLAEYQSIGAMEVPYYRFRAEKEVA